MQSSFSLPTARAMVSFYTKRLHKSVHSRNFGLIIRPLHVLIFLLLTRTFRELEHFEQKGRLDFMKSLTIRRPQILRAICHHVH